MFFGRLLFIKKMTRDSFADHLNIKASPDLSISRNPMNFYKYERKCKTCETEDRAKDGTNDIRATQKNPNESFDSFEP